MVLKLIAHTGLLALLLLLMQVLFHGENDYKKKTASQFFFRSQIEFETVKWQKKQHNVISIVSNDVNSIKTQEIDVSYILHLLCVAAYTHTPFNLFISTHVHSRTLRPLCRIRQFC